MNCIALLFLCAPAGEIRRPEKGRAVFCIIFRKKSSLLKESGPAGRLVSAGRLHKGGMVIKALRIVLALAAAAAACVLFWMLVQKKQQQAAVSIPEPEIIYTGEDFIMDTYVSQKTCGEGADQLIPQAAALLEELEKEWSAWSADSVPGRINAMAGVSPVTLEPAEYDILRQVMDFSAETGGMFDPTIGPLVKLWDIGGESPSVPSADQISTALSYVGMENVTMDDENLTVYLDRPGVALDFGASIKGYGVEQVLKLYQESGVQGALISLGGNVAATGQKPTEDGGTEDFVIGLRDPLGSATDYYGTLVMNDKVICTSGGYERYFEQDGKRYHHILDPATGYPAETDLLAVTVIGEDGLRCDCLSTWLFMSGLDTVKEHLEEQDYAVIAVDNQNRIWCSSSLKDAFALTSDRYTLAS